MVSYVVRQYLRANFSRELHHTAISPEKKIKEYHNLLLNYQREEWMPSMCSLRMSSPCEISSRIQVRWKEHRMYELRTWRSRNHDCRTVKCNGILWQIFRGRTQLGLTYCFMSCETMLLLLVLNSILREILESNSLLTCRGVRCCKDLERLS